MGKVTEIDALSQAMLDEMQVGEVRAYTLPTMVAVQNAQSNISTYSRAKGVDQGCIVRSIANQERPQLIVVKMPRGREWALI